MSVVRGKRLLPKAREAVEYLELAKRRAAANSRRGMDFTKKGILMQRFIVVMVACAVLAGAAPFASAQEKGANVGMLRCNEASGWGLVFGSTKDLRCVFAPSEKGAKSVHFTGTIKKYGVDIGFTENAVILWAVVSTSDKFTPGDIAGSYGGVTASAAWAAGLGANVLLGGSKQGFALQPLSVQGYNGINVAAGVTEVELKAAP